MDTSARVPCLRSRRPRSDRLSHVPGGGEAAGESVACTWSRPRPRQGPGARGAPVCPTRRSRLGEGQRDSSLEVPTSTRSAVHSWIGIYNFSRMGRGKFVTAGEMTNGLRTDEHGADHEHSEAKG